MSQQALGGVEARRAGSSVQHPGVQQAGSSQQPGVQHAGIGAACGAPPVVGVVAHAEQRSTRGMQRVRIEGLLGVVRAVIRSCVSSDGEPKGRRSARVFFLGALRAQRP